MKIEENRKIGTKHICVGAPTSVHGPTSEERSILVNTPSMTSGVFPWDLEDSR